MGKFAWNMAKEKITQQDAVLLLLKHKSDITFSSIRDELPGYYRKNLANTIQKMIDTSLLGCQQGKKDIDLQYFLTKNGEKIFDRRYTELRNNKSTRKKLDGLDYAFGM